MPILGSTSVSKSVVKGFFLIGKGKRANRNFKGEEGKWWR